MTSVHAGGHKRVVIKIGTSSLTYYNGGMNLRKIDRLSWTLADLRNQGHEVIFVSSGAIAVGTERLGLRQRPRDNMGKQAASAVGQAALMQIYENFFLTYNQKIAQILLTKDVVEDGVRKTNARNTFFTLLSMGVVPIVNENDAISTDELGFSENDELSAYVAILTDADTLIILSDTDGFYDCDPKKNPDARLIPVVEEIGGLLERAAGAPSSALGTGGAAAKLSAAKMACAAGIDTVVASGEDPYILYDILAGDIKGTLFKASCKNPR
ncbi:MAG: glutamate 5-kinase [Firmicutes bacterium]|nr:glutamate 5-kinase [Bacillota bacterium]